MKKRSLLSVLLLLAIIMFIYGRVAVALELPGHTEDSVVEVYDQEGRYIFSTAMGVSVGDRYINENNKEYQIIKVEGGKALAKYTGEVDLLGKGLIVATQIEPLIARPEEKKMALYFTHSGESYLPQKPLVRGRGGIYDIGAALARALEGKGIKTIVSENLHLPHDAAAYDRSRRTAKQLMQNRPDALFDIHRDAIPRKEEYLKRVDGKLISQVRIVVGRQNPNREANEKLAKHLKAVADRLHPGLIKGIFFGRGKYNQDLSTRALLFEFGTHVTTKEQAIASTYMLADAINQLFYGKTAEGRAARQEESSSALGTALWILVITIAGVIAYLFINEGSWEGVKGRLRTLWSREFKFLWGSGDTDDQDGTE